MVMSEESGRYTSIKEVRSSFYPGSAGMLDLEKGEILDFPSTLVGKTRQIMEDIAKKSGSDVEKESAADEL